MNIDEFFMQRALQLARKGMGSTSPNPMVGAVLVYQGKIVGEGYHKRAGSPHAEVEALKDAKSNTKGTTLYVNLEPCSHYGKTPPCTRAIIDAGIGRVVIAMEDPNPRVCGEGIRSLRESGIEVTIGVLREQALRLNEVFIKYITQKRPFVTAKIAQSVDGKIALSSGDSKWITGPEARKRGHQFRSIYDSIMVGIGTVIADDPKLTARVPDKIKDPIKIIIDSTARLPPGSNVLKPNGNVILATAKDPDPRRLQTLEAMGVKIIETSDKGKVNLEELLIKLGELEISSILVEGGPKVLTSLLEKHLIDKLMVFISPKIVGGDGKSALDYLYIDEMQDIYSFHISHIERIYEDVLLTMYPKG